MSEKIYKSASELIGKTPLLELTNIEKILEKQAIEYERELSQLKEQFTQAVEERAREVISGKKVGKVPESINGYYGKKFAKPAYHWQTRYR